MFLVPFFKSFITLFIITDVLGNLPFFMALSEGMTHSERLRVFTTAVAAGLLLLVFFLLIGMAILDLFKVTLDDFKIAGGILLLLISAEILLRGKINVEHKEDIGIFPLACPLLVGPGAITTSLVLLKLYGYPTTLGAIFACFFLVWIILYFSEPIYNFLGRNGSLILTKIAAILIAAIAVQFIRQGIISVLFNKPII
ncbi:MAG: MarC family protein [Candidatus Margulisiibacteriota bacterium]